MACNHKYGAAYPDSSQSSGYARECGLCGDIIEANEGDTCDHNWVATENVGFSSGYGYVCTMCGELGEELDPQPSHSHDWHSDGTVTSTCTESGYTNYVCNCGETRKDDYTPALGHNWVAESNGGFSSGYGYVCSRCGELGEELECTHSYSSEVDGSRVYPTCTEAGYVSYICDDCGHIWQESLPALGHDWGEPFYSNEFSSGYGQKCNRCGDLMELDPPDEPTPPAHTHTWQKGATVSPTCTAPGYTTYYCSCGGTKTGDTIAAFGHAYHVPYYSDEFSSGYGKQCVRCGDLVELDPPVTECQHEFAFNKTVAATCEAEGYDLYICSKCGAQEQRNKTSALGHTAGAWVEDKAATCTAKGSRHQVCAVCGKTIKTEEIPALGHKWVAEENDGFSSGYGYVCSNCGELGEELTKPENGGGDDGEELLIKKSTLTAIADAVREKTGGTETMTASEIPQQIHGMVESDPTVPDWAKQPAKPTYTAAEIGAAPAGYGEGTKQDGEKGYFANVGGAIGWYRIATAQSYQFSALVSLWHAYASGGSSDDLWSVSGLNTAQCLRSLGASASNPALVNNIRVVNTGSYTRAVDVYCRLNSKNSWSINIINTAESRLTLQTPVFIGADDTLPEGETLSQTMEWANPPMQLGVEYRTTERYKGKPLYVKAVDCGELPVSTNKVIEYGDSQCRALFCYGECGGTTIPTMNFGSYLDPTFPSASIISLWGNANTLCIACGGDRSGISATVIVKYWKTTD